MLSPFFLLPCRLLGLRITLRNLVYFSWLRPYLDGNLVLDTTDGSSNDTSQGCDGCMDDYGGFSLLLHLKPHVNNSHSCYSKPSFPFLKKCQTWSHLFNYQAYLSSLLSLLLQDLILLIGSYCRFQQWMMYHFFLFSASHFWRWSRRLYYLILLKNVPHMWGCFLGVKFPILVLFKD